MVKESIESLLAFNSSRSKANRFFKNDLEYGIEESRNKIERVENKTDDTEKQRFIEHAKRYLDDAEDAIERNEFRRGYMDWYYTQKNLFDYQWRVCDEEDFEYRLQKREIKSSVEDHLSYVDDNRKESTMEILYKDTSITYREWHELLYSQIRGILNFYDEKKEKSNKQDSIIRRLGYFVIVSTISLFLICIFPLVSILYSPLSPPSIFGEASPYLFFYVPVFGVLGASFFGTIMERKRFDMDDYSEETPGRFRFWFAIARIAVGAVAAMTTFIFIESGVLVLTFRVEQTVFTPPYILLLSFVSGYSERFLVDALRMQTEMVN